MEHVESESKFARYYDGTALSADAVATQIEYGNMHHCDINDLSAINH